MPVGGHDHFNWGFTKPGVYELELTFSGTHITDGLLSASGRFTFLVGDTTVVPEPGAWLLVLSGLAPFGLGWLRRRV
jgi:surface-anchored protein